MDAGIGSSTHYSPLPTELDTSRQGHGLEVFRDKLTIHYRGLGAHSTDVGSIQANRPAPLTTSCFYFEITVLEKGDWGRIAIGYTDRAFKLNKQPGWEPESYGYHGDDGKKFGGTAKGEDYGPKFGKGDTIGAAYHLTRQEIFFTKNGNRLRTAFRGVKGELYPTVGLHSKGEVIKVNFGQQPFKFDVEAMLSEERAIQAAATERIPVSSELVHQVVRQYLLHYGYGDTLRAFDSEAGPGVTDGGDGDEDEEGEAAQQRHQNGVGAHANGCSEGLADDGPCSMAVDGDPDDSGTTAATANGSARPEPLPAASASMATDEGPGVAAAGPGSQAAAAAAAVWEGDWARDGALPVRQYVRRAIMGGDVQAAVDCIAHVYPQILQDGTGFEAVRFHLATQQYIELVRAGAIEAAVAFAQTSLAALIRPPASTSGAGGSASDPGPSAGPSSSSVAAGPLNFDAPNEAALRDVVALIAYEDPEASPLAWLLGPEQRERVADAANAALLRETCGGDGPEGEHLQSRVEQLLTQLVAVHETSFELNGSQGEVFNLRDHLAPQPQQPQQHASMQCN